MDPGTEAWVGEGRGAWGGEGEGVESEEKGGGREGAWGGVHAISKKCRDILVVMKL
jgi:hypothetical protein